MRNLSFALTTKQFLDGSKTVTRRLGWNKPTCKAEPGMRLMGVEKVQGIKKGEMKRLGEIEIVSVKREPLYMITDLDVVREGFPDMDAVDFVTIFCGHMDCQHDTEVTRIEFDYVDLHQNREPCPRCKGRHSCETLYPSRKLYCQNCRAVWRLGSDEFEIANPKLEVQS